MRSDRKIQTRVTPYDAEAAAEVICGSGQPAPPPVMVGGFANLDRQSRPPRTHASWRPISLGHAHLASGAPHGTGSRSTIYKQLRLFASEEHRDRSGASTIDHRARDFLFLPSGGRHGHPGLTALRRSAMQGEGTPVCSSSRYAPKPFRGIICVNNSPGCGERSGYDALVVHPYA